jgi:hypothetical protein
MDLEQKIAKAITSKLYLHFRADFIAAGMPPPPPPVPMQEAVAADIVRSVLSCIEEEGMVVVPREPTEAMLMAGAYDEYSGHTEMAAAITWRAMLAAKP